MTDATTTIDMTGEYEIASEAIGIVISGGDRSDEPARFVAYEWALPDDEREEAA